jgi:protease YdgD
MRLLAAAATIAACLVVSVAAGSREGAPLTQGFNLTGASAFDSATAQSIAAFEKQIRKRPGEPGPGNDSCRWANDNECDDPDIGTGACALGTDISDCRAIRQGENDSCRWARDGECDEPGFGTGACVQGTDRTDCGAIAWMRNQSDRCDTAFNGICEEPGQGRSGTCAARTDRADCHGRERPMTINDHFFGRDDRVLVPVNQMPWRMMGTLLMDTGESCTATLIARDVIVTAAHCIHSEGNRVNAAARFTTADGQSNARVTAYLIDPRFNYQRFNTTDEIDGMDWALLRLDQPLGDRVGFAGVRNLTGEGRAVALATDLQQAGYSWDTGENLSGNLRCRMVVVHNDNTFAHECDTTRGDSGSAFVVRNARGGYDVVGTDSNFRSNPGGPFIYIAVSASAWAARAPDFIAGRSGTPIGQRAAGSGRK